MLLRIVYVSTLSDDVSNADLTLLVEKAAEFNKTQAITGVLAIEERRVCQIMEGPAEALTALFESIRRDKRHSGVVELVHEPIDAVTFEAWGMARRQMSDMVMTAFTL